MRDKITRLEQIATRLRLLTVHALYEAQSGHAGAAMSIADLITALYFDEMRFTEGRHDRFVLSKGHGVAILYATFAELGWLKENELNTLREIGSRLQGHPDMTRLPYLDAGTGALGQGASIAIGYALAARLSKSDNRAYTIIGDGECQEGQIWEAAMYASARGLDNVTVIIDVNRYQNEDSVEATLPMDSLPERWHSFGWRVFDIDGHDFRQILEAYAQAKATKGQPSVIIARTVKGKGIRFMENNNAWHSNPMGEADYKEAVRQLKQPSGENVDTIPEK